MFFIKTQKDKLLLFYVPICLCVCILFNGCILHDSVLQKSLHKRGIELPVPLRPPLLDSEDETEAWRQIRLQALKVLPDEKYETHFKATPEVPLPLPESMDVRTREKAGSGKKRITINLDAMALPAFINDVYGGILKQSFEIDSSLRNRKDLVTLRAEKPMTPSELDTLARQVLGNYGITVEPQGDLLRFVPSRGTVSGEPPFLVSGRTLPEVPMSHRPIFQVVPLNVVRNIHVAGWLKQAYKGQKLDIFEDPERNAVMLMGTPPIVEQALKAIRMLDQPYMRGRHSVRIEPMFLNADELSKILVDTLNSEGYSASLKPPSGSIIVLPVRRVNAVLVFAADASALEHVRQWASLLDRPGQKSDQGGAFFYYQIRNTRAQEIASLLEKVISADTHKKKGTSKSSALVVDEVRNGLIFQGDFDEWARLVPVIRELDRPARMVLIEVTVAEVTLNDQEELGVEWLLNNISIDSADMALGTLGGLGIGGQGLSYMLDNAGQTRALLNAFAASSRVSILSTPRVMVKSGGTATIDVGTEVPVITSQSTSSDLQQNGNSAILQEVQYRKTGILLSVSPVVHSGNRIDLDISQEVSESKPNTMTNISTPNISTRKINTSLGLKDGSSVLLGGLISSSTNQGYSGVPGLSDIPILGHLFRVRRDTEDRTEMIMLIVPYVIDNSQEAEAITESFQRQLEHLPLAVENQLMFEGADGTVYTIRKPRQAALGHDHQPSEPPGWSSRQSEPDHQVSESPVYARESSMSSGNNLMPLKIR